MADNICPRADARRSPLNFLVSSMRPSMGSDDTSAFGIGCRLTSKLPVALFMATTSLRLTRLEMWILDKTENIAPGIEYVGDEDVIADILDVEPRLGAEFEQACVGAG